MYPDGLPEYPVIFVSTLFFVYFHLLIKYIYTSEIAASFRTLVFLS